MRYVFMFFAMVLIFCVGEMLNLGNNLLAQQSSQTTVFGRIVSAADTTMGMANVAVTITQDARTVRTDAQGYYSFANVPEGRYYVFPLQSGTRFEHIVTTIIVTNTSNTIHVSPFKGTALQPSIYGSVVTATYPPKGVENVEISIGDSLIARTDVNGHFCIPNLRYQQRYTLVPRISGGIFLPAKRTITVTGHDKVVKFAVEVLPSALPIVQKLFVEPLEVNKSLMVMLVR